MLTSLTTDVVTTPLCFFDDYILSQRADLQAFNMVEMSTGLLAKTFKPYRNLKDRNDILGTCLSGHKLMLYSLGSVCYFFDVDKSCGIGASKLKYNADILDACGSRASDSMFFFVSKNSTTVRAMMSTATGVTLSPQLRLENMDRTREYITGIQTHPSKSYLFISYTKGTIQVWNYKNIRKNLLSKSGEDNPEGLGDDNNDDGDRGWDGDTEQASTSRRSTKYSFSPVAFLRGSADGRDIASSLILDGVGRLSGVVWSSTNPGTPDVISVYDTRFTNTVDMKLSALGTYELTPDIGFRITSASFHPSEPILYIVVTNGDAPAAIAAASTSAGGATVVALMLLEPGLRAISHHSLDFKPFSIKCHGSGNGVVLATYDMTGCSVDTSQTRPGQGTGTRPVRLVHMRIGDVMARYTSWMTPVVSPLVVPPEAFVEGDAVLQQKCTYGGPWPVSLVLQPEIEVYTPGTRSGENKLLRPLSVFFNVYRVKPNISSQEAAGLVYVGSIPSLVATKVADRESRPWIHVHEENALTTVGFFTPHSLKTNHLIPGGQSESGAWDAILVGNSFYGAKQSMGNVLKSISAVVCLRFTPPAVGAPGIASTASGVTSTGELSTVYANYKDAVFYSPSPGQSTTSPARPYEILALHADGMTLEILPQSDEDIASARQLTPLSVKMCAVFSAPKGCSNVLVFCSEPALPAAVQTIYMTAPGQLCVEPSMSRQMDLLPGERVIDCQWQPLIITGVSESDNSKARHQCWSDPSGQMLGLLTTQRVLLLSSSLCELNSYWNDGKGRQSGPLCLPDKALNINWVGRSLVYLLESGAIEYMAPCLYGSSLSRRPLAVESMARSLGLRLGLDTNRGRLCTLGKKQSMMGFTRVIGYLPDRMIYTTITMVSGLPYASLMVRPCLPVEALIVGLIQPPLPPPEAIQVSRPKIALNADPFAPFPTESAPATAVLPVDMGVVMPDLTTDNMIQFKVSLLEALITMYIPAKPLTGATSEGGALLMSQSTRRLCLAMIDAGYDNMALAAAGVCSNASEGTGADFPRTRWVSPGVKFMLSIRAGKFGEACNDLLSARPELQELFLDPESYGGGTLPHRESAYSRQYGAAARVLAALGQYDMARKLADIAGDDAFLSALLASDKSSDRKSNLQSLYSSLAGKSGRYYRILEGFLEGEELTKDSEKSLRDWEIPVLGIGGCDRRMTMLALSRPLSNQRHDPASRIDLQKIEREQRSHTGSRGGGLGPPTKLGVLAMDTVEDYAGKAKPEVVSAGGGITSRIGGPSAGGKQGEEEEVLGAGVERPETWVDDIGTGKEWDKISGYWRYSDIYRPGDEEFISSGEPKARLNILDLSKYSVPAELFADSPDRMVLETSTSAVDPGEDHEKVKGLNDIVFSQRPIVDDTIPVAGLRAVVGRGTALDIGMFHTDANRNHMTIELNILRSPEAVADKAPPGGHCLMKRCIGKPEVSSAHFMNEIWSLSVDGQGTLCFTAGGNTVKSGANEVNMGPSADIPVSVWTHIAVVVDTSGGNGMTAMVSLFVNGNRSAKEQMVFSHFSEADLATTTLYMGCNLTGWRMTEVRLWADSRQTVDIEGQRDNYLPLASKRKRMQFRIKGSKKLFGPPPESLAIGGVDPPAGSRIAATPAAGGGGSSESNGSTPSKGLGLAAPGGLSAPGGGSARGGLAAPGGLASPVGLTSLGGLSSPGGDLSGVAARRNRRASVGGLPAPTGGGLAPPGGGGLRPPPPRGLQPPPSPHEHNVKPSGRDLDENDDSETSSIAASRIPVSAASEEDKPHPPAAFSPSPSSSDEKKVHASQLKAPGGLLAPAPGSANARKGRRSSVGSVDASALSTKVAMVRFESGSDLDPTKVVEKDIAVAGLTPTDVVRCIRRRALSNGLAMVTPTHAHSFEDNDAVVVVDMPKKTDGELLCSRYNISAESAIISPSTEARILAYYKQKKLIIKNVTTDHTLVEMPMSLPHVYWTYDGPDSILLISAYALFSWDVNPARVASTRPVKLMDRVDITDSKR